MSTNIQKKADHIQLAPWHLSPREISLIEPCRDLWLEVQKNNRPHGMYKIQEMLSEGVDEGERNAATFIRARNMRDAGYSESETLKELCSWNQLNRPPIVSIAEIRATVMSTFRHRPLRVTNMGAKSVLDLIRDQLRPLNLSPSEFTAVIVALSVTNTKENDWNGESIGVGELITSLESLANRSGVKKSQVRSMIKKIKDAGFVEISVLPGRLGSRWEWQGEFKKIFLGVETTENLDDD